MMDALGETYTTPMSLQVHANRQCDGETCFAPVSVSAPRKL